MTPDEYQRLALRTAATLDGQQRVINGAMGLAGEAGEVADSVKKWLYQGHALDHERLAHELGDILWYVALLSDTLGYGLEQIMAMNVRKLEARYPGGVFDADRSRNREETHR
jgi:Predicted pyrophosphatase